MGESTGLFADISFLFPRGRRTKEPQQAPGAASQQSHWPGRQLTHRHKRENSPDGWDRQQPLASSLLFGSQRKTEEGAAIPLAKGLIPLGSAPSSTMPPECQAAADVRWQSPGCQGLKEREELSSASALPGDLRKGHCHPKMSTCASSQAGLP